MEWNIAKDNVRGDPDSANYVETHPGFDWDSFNKHGKGEAAESPEKDDYSAPSLWDRIKGLFR